MNVNIRDLDGINLVLNAIKDVKRQIVEAETNGVPMEVRKTLYGNLLALENCLVTEADLLLLASRNTLKQVA